MRGVIGPRRGRGHGGILGSIRLHFEAKRAEEAMRKAQEVAINFAAENAQLHQEMMLNRLKYEQSRSTGFAG